MSSLPDLGSPFTHSTALPGTGLDEAVAATPPPAANGFESIVAEQQQQDDAVLSSAVRWSQKFKPDQYAEAGKLAGGLVEPDVAHRQIDFLRLQKKNAEYAQLFSKSPELKQHFVDNPKDLPYANPDELDQLSGLNWAWQAGLGSLQQGTAMLRASQSRVAIDNGTATMDDWMNVARYKQDQGRTFGAHGFLEKGLTGAAATLPYMAETALAGIRGGVEGAAIGGLGGAAVGSVVPGAGTAAGAVAGFSGGAAVGARYRALDFLWQTSRGSMLMALDDIKDANGKKLDPEVASFAAATFGLGSAGLELLSEATMLKLVPGSEKLTKFFSPEVVAGALKNPTVLGAVTGMAKNFAKVGGTEVTTEVLQETTQIVAEEYTKQNSEGDWATIDPETAANRLLETAKQTIGAMAFLGPVLAGSGFVSDLHEIRQSKRNLAAVQGLIDSANQNQFVQRAPEAAQRVIDQLSQGQTISIPAQQMAELFQSVGEDVFGPPLANWRNRLQEALSVSGDVKISLGEYISHMATNPKLQTLRDLVRVDPRDYLPAEIQHITEAADALLKSSAAKAEGGQVADVGAPQVHINISDMLKAVGYTPEAASAIAAPLAEAFATAAYKAQAVGQDITALDMAQRYLAGIERGVAPQTDFVGYVTTPDGTTEFDQPAWHGSPHIFDEFSTQYMGTGEGAQAFGWGMYFAGSRGLAENYRKTLAGQNQVTFGGVPMRSIDHSDVIGGRKIGEHGFNVLERLGKGTDLETVEINLAKEIRWAEADKQANNLDDYDSPAQLDRVVARKQAELLWLQQNKDLIQVNKDPGRLYEVDLPENDQLMLWDAPLSEQSEIVQQALQEAIVTLPDGEGLLDLYNSAQDMTAQEFYGTLATERKVAGEDERLGDRGASELLQKHGIPGHRFLAGSARHKGLGENPPEDFNYVIYADPHVKVKNFFQDQGSRRGSITFDEAGKALIRQFETGDMSTMLHEFSHLFLEMYRDLSKSIPEIAADYEIIRRELGITTDEPSVDQHETFARMGEAYFMKGKAPSAALEPAFKLFKRWLRQIYKSIKALNVKINPEIEGVFNRMFATEEAMARTTRDSAYRALFADAASMGVSQEDYLAYQKLTEDLKQIGMEALTEKAVGQVKRLTSGWRNEIRKELAFDAEDKLKKQAPYVHMEALKKPGFSINREEFNKRYSPEAAKKFPRAAFGKNGLDPDVAAELLGYPSADDMVNDFRQAPPIKEAAKQMALAEMAQRYDENFEDSELIRVAARNALAQDGRVTVLATEYSALSRKAGREVGSAGPKAFAKEIAEQTIGSKKFKDLDRRMLQAASQRSATMAESFAVKGKWNEAADWKRKQVLAQAMDNEAQRVTDVVAKIRAKAARYARKASDSIDPATMEQIRTLVEAYEFTKVSKKRLAARETLAQWADRVENEGEAVDIDPRLLKEAAKRNYAELTVEELLAFGDTLDNMESIGRKTQKILVAGRQQEFREVRDEVKNSILQREKRTKKSANALEEKLGVADWAADFTASWLKPEQIIEWLDLGEVNGPLARYIFQPIAAAEVARNELNTEYNKKIVEIFQDVPAKYLMEVRNIPALERVAGLTDTRMTMEQIYAVALNMGNSSNMAKLMQAELWDENILDAIVSHLTPEDAARIQKVWNVLDSLWPKIDALEKRLTGVSPPKIEPRPVVIAGQALDGGYYPVVYDFKARRGLGLVKDITPVDKQYADGIFANKFIAPGTSHKHTTKRTGTAKPINLSLSVLPGHINNVIHDLTHREAIRGAYKILWDPEIRRAIEDVESPYIYKQLQEWLKSVATERAVENDGTVRGVDHMRVGMTMYGLGFRLSTALAQPLGMLQAMKRTGPGSMAKALVSLTRRPITSYKFVVDKSGEMRHRFNQQDRDIRFTVKKLRLAESKFDKVRSMAFWMVGVADQLVSVTTWLAAYGDQIRLSPQDDAKAIAHADRTVRLSQGTGSAKDMAHIMNKPGYAKLFTMFYSGFSALWNEQVDLTRKTKRDIAEGDFESFLLNRVPQWMYLVAIPAVLGALLSGNGPDDDESKAAWLVKTVLLYPLAGMPFVRDIAGSLGSGMPYQLSPIARIGQDAVRAARGLFSEDPQDTWKPIASVAAVALHLPAGQLITAIDALGKGMEQGDLEATDLVFGRRGK